MLEIAFEIIMPRKDSWAFSFLPAIQLSRDGGYTGLHFSWLCWGIGISFQED